MACSDGIGDRVEDKIQTAALRERTESPWWYASWKLQDDIVSVRRLVSLGSSHLSIDSSACVHEQPVRLPQVEALLRHSRIASTILGIVTTLEKAALTEVELFGMGIEPNDRRTTRIHRSFKVVSVSQCLH
jgi:hypothetical protein